VLLNPWKRYRIRRRFPTQYFGEFELLCCILRRLYPNPPKHYSFLIKFSLSLSLSLSLSMVLSLYSSHSVSVSFCLSVSIYLSVCLSVCVILRRISDAGGSISQSHQLYEFDIPKPGAGPLRVTDMFPRVYRIGGVSRSKHYGAEGVCCVWQTPSRSRSWGVICWPGIIQSRRTVQ